MGKDYFLATSLPALLPFGEPPLTAQALLESVAHNNSAKAAVEAILLSGDLIQRQAYLAGEITEVSMAVLSDQVFKDGPLPDYLVPKADTSAPQQPDTADQVWVAYYRHLMDLGGRLPNEFLVQWAQFEAGLRQAVAVARAEALALESGLVAIDPDLIGGQWSYTQTISQWSSAQDPLEATKVLDMARWDWLVANEDYFGFSNEELAAYAAKLTIVLRWARLQKQADAE